MKVLRRLKVLRGEELKTSKSKLCLMNKVEGGERLTDKMKRTRGQM